MDRYNDVKIQLKTWEQGFVKDHQRKPNKEDIDQAPDETRILYKEYRSLKQAKDNSSSDAGSGHVEQARSTAAVNTPQKEGDCWGSHLNRSSQPAPSSRLTAEERDNLQASAQYYGMKLKNNMGTLGKERPVSLKKSFLPGRVPLNSLKDGLTGQTNSPVATPVKNPFNGPRSSPFTPRRFNTPQGLASKTPQKAEPEEPCEPFESVKDSCEKPASAAISYSSPSVISRTLRGDVGATGKLNESIGALGDKEEHVDNFRTPHKVDDEAGVGALISLRGSPQVIAGFRGGMAGKPSPASRLSFVDKKWLERCQVFGEMGAEVKPGAGNMEMDVEKRGECEEGRETKVKTQEEEKSGKEEIHVAEERRAAKVLGEVKEPKSITHDKTVSESEPEPSLQHTGKSHQGKRKGKAKEKEDIEEMERRLTPPLTPEEDNEESNKSKGGKKKGKKRQREAEHMDAETPEEGGEPTKLPQENLLGEIEEDYKARRAYKTQPAKVKGMKGAEGNFVKINLKKKSHVKGYALRGAGLRKQIYMEKFQLKGERFGGHGFLSRGGGGGFRGGGYRGGFRGGMNQSGDTCYKCGGTGHWAIHCKGPAPPPSAAEDQAAEEEPFDLPTLEEVARATGTLQPQPMAASSSTAEEQPSQDKQGDGNTKDEVLLNVIRPDYERPVVPPPMEPLFPLTDDGKVQEAPPELYEALKELGYQSFRPGQAEAIMRILSGLSTLVVLSTGMVSLMDDQVSGLPANLKAACIHSNMSKKQREAAIEKVKAGEVCVLLLSPEALVGGGGSGAGCLPSAQDLPPVAFACIDEAHCVSEWSHNFRPCYLRLCKVLRERLGVQCLLGLTATATLSTAMDIARHLNINDKDGIAVRSAAVPPNLHLSVSMDREKDQALVSLLKGDRFGCLDSIIVYCTRREETTRISALLRTCLQGVILKENKNINRNSQAEYNPVGQKKKDLARKKIRKPLKWQAESYHAGLSSSERRRVQNNFMCGELRLVVATVAFGMGLDKSDVRGIIHYNMPKSFESYVQEIGRAGRDGEPAHCHLFLNPGDMEDKEMMEMMDMCDQENLSAPTQQDVEHTDTPEQSTSQESSHPEAAELPLQDCKDEGKEMQLEEKKEEQRVKHEEAEGSIKPKDGDSQEADWLKDQEEESSDWPKERVCHTHERAIPMEATVEALDVTEEGVETLLCYLELHPQRFVELLHPTLSVCKIGCYSGPKQLQKLTKICPPIAVVLARRRMAGERVETCDQLEFDVVEVADTMGWQLSLVKRGLRQLQWSSVGGRSGVSVELSSISFYFRSFGDLSDEEMDRVCQFLYTRVQNQEKTQIYQLTSSFKAFKSASSCVDDLDESRSLRLKDLLSDYFDKRRDLSQMLAPVYIEELDKYKFSDWENQIRADIRSFLSNRSDEKFSGRAVARILHGIGSPCFPAQIYGRDRRYWRKYIQFDFNQLIRLATQEIIHFK
ncbi:ATP-dependent DNA helicase Q4 [Dissostichus eleginoides]|uniref:DNA 3'-5' helicase n=1 Tax=Dissostichus eleginoides TaxID=100907 RepID=A0AAD9BCK1_DISEL|nr:ATP-dependent DNA helicase Q4 [Dissostichus eleginoides]